MVQNLAFEGRLLQEEVYKGRLTFLLCWVEFDWERRRDRRRHSLAWTLRGAMNVFICWMSFSPDCPCLHKAHSPMEQPGIKWIIKQMSTYIPQIDKWNILGKMELLAVENRKPNDKVERTLAIRTIWVLIPVSEYTGFLILGVSFLSFINFKYPVHWLDIYIVLATSF